jgi:hypothetical protein
MRWAAFTSLALSLCSTATFAEDVRLHSLRDLDHPVSFEPDFKSANSWKQRAASLREQVLVAEGLWPLPERTPLNAVIHGRIDRDGYTIEKVFFASYPGHYVSGNLYRPRNHIGKLPVVLSPHGHWANGRMYEATDADANAALASGGESTMNGAKFPLQARCAMLARMGCIVFMYDMVGYADSTQIEHRTGFTDADAILRLQSFMGLQTWNSIRALDFISGLDDADPSRIAVTGESGGGTQTLILGTVDDRPAIEFPAVMVSQDMQGGCICENAPLLRIDTNNIELTGTFAPKPLGMSAANDWTREMETVAYPKLQKVYSLFHAQQNVLGKHFSFPHNYNQVSREMMYNWFNDHLKLGWASPVTELPFNPVPPKELSVYDEEHPRPADSAAAPALRKTMREASDHQLDALWIKNPEAYRATVLVALKKMIADDLPPADQVEREMIYGRTNSKHCIVEFDVLSRKNANEAVPYLRLLPENWNGHIVIWCDGEGKASLLDEDGNPTGEAAYLVGRGDMVVSADLFLTGESKNASTPLTRPANAISSNQKYAGFIYGYNRSILANRAHDLLTVIADCKATSSDVKRIDLIGTGEVAAATLVARAIANDSIDRAAIDLAGFDFDRITDPLDPQMLPGALKYGGINGIAALCTHGHTMIYGARRDKDSYSRAFGTASLSLTVERPPTSESLVDFLEEN